MEINLPLSPETERKLRQQAQAAGQDLKSFVLEALEERLAVGMEKLSDDLSPQEKISRFRAWLSTHKSKVTFVDDSRESIYEGRGE